MRETILAKSSISGRSQTLLSHTKHVMAAVELLFGAEDQPTRLAQEWLRFFCLKENDYVRFLVNTMASAGCHDLGKANDGFQNAVTKGGDQSIRHEHLSGLLLSWPAFKDWFSYNPLLDFNVILSSVISHHLKVDPERWGQRLGMSSSFRVLTDQDGFTELLDVIGEKLNLPVPFRPDIPLLWSFQANSSFFNFADLLESAKQQAYRFQRAVRRDEDVRRFLCSTKAALLAADSAGSGIVRADHDLQSWLKAAFGTPLSAQDIQNKVIAPRVREIERRTRRNFQLQDFQDRAGTLGERALLLAPCGSGKTLAAWRWIASRLENRPATRVLFLYPTRATATEGFRDYVSWAPEEDAVLAHGTAAYDLEEMFENPTDPRTAKDFTTEQRLYALGFWQKRLFSATADQFLAFMQNQYAPLCLLPLLVDSVIVVDEIHSFDKVMFSSFTTFLKQFNVPVLCMTATLSAGRRRTLVDECGLELFPDMFDRGLDNLKERAEHPRYRLDTTSRENAERKAQQALQEKKKVLWVTNQVRKCQEIAISMSRQFGPEAVQCYHSRFKLADRRTRHNSVVSSFQAPSGPRLAITTQVCEMSLDLDADILITEHAPIAALIQRMGRCNRRGEPGDGKLGEVYIYPPADSLPYKSEEMREARPFVNALEGKVLSQSDLEATMEKHQPIQREPERFSSFLESGSYAMSYPYREGEEFTVPAVLDSDIEAWLLAVEHRQPADGFIVPVPRRLAVPNSSLGKFLKEAPSAHYHSAYGFLNQPVASEE